MMGRRRKQAGGAGSTIGATESESKGKQTPPLEGGCGFDGMKEYRNRTLT